jgi:hypothetical protein
MGFELEGAFISLRKRMFSLSFSANSNKVKPEDEKGGRPLD